MTSEEEKKKHEELYDEQLETLRGLGASDKTNEMLEAMWGDRREAVTTRQASRNFLAAPKKPDEGNLPLLPFFPVIRHLGVIMEAAVEGLFREMGGMEMSFERDPIGIFDYRVITPSTHPYHVFKPYTCVLPEDGTIPPTNALSLTVMEVLSLLMHRRDELFPWLRAGNILALGSRWDAASRIPCFYGRGDNITISSMEINEDGKVKTSLEAFFFLCESRW